MALLLRRNGVKAHIQPEGHGDKSLSLLQFRLHEGRLLGVHVEAHCDAYRAPSDRARIY